MDESEQNQPNYKIFKDKIARIDNMFRQYQIYDQLKPKQPSQPAIAETNYNARGQIILSPKEVRINYQNAIPGFKWYQMPLCRRSVRRKLNFWAPASVALAWTYGQFVKKKDQSNLTKSLPFKFYVRAYLCFFTLASAYSLAQSLLFEEYCDIDSSFYQQNQSRLSIARRIKGQMNNTKDGGFLRQIF